MRTWRAELFAEFVDVLVNHGVHHDVSLLLTRAERCGGIVSLDLLIDFQSLVVFLLAFEEHACLEEIFSAECGHVSCLGCFLEGVDGFVDLFVGGVAVGECEESLCGDGVVALGAELFETLDGFLGFAELVVAETCLSFAES